MGKIFKNAFLGGFRKKDVINYLDVLGHERRIEAARFDEELALLEKRNDELVRQLAQYQKSTGRQRVLAEQSHRLSKELDASKSGWAAREAALLERVQGLEDRCEMLEAEQGSLTRREAALKAEKTALVAKIVKLEEAAALPRSEQDSLAFSLPRGVATDRNMLGDMKARLLEIIEEINSLMEEDGGKASGNHGTGGESAPLPEQTAKKLGSVRDILSFVRTQGEHN